jgi:small-conductance mechanosensitive channel
MVRDKIFYLCFLWSVVHLLIINPAIGQQEVTESPDSLKKSVLASPVKPFGESLFSFTIGIGPFTASARAKAVEDRIREVAADPFFRPDSLRLIRADETINIMYEDIILTTVTTRDSTVENLTKEKIAAIRMHRIANAIVKYKDDNSEKNIVRSIIYSLVVLVLLAVLFFVVNRLFRIIKQKILIWKGSQRKILSISGYEFLDKKRQVAIFLFLNKVLRTALFLFLLFIGLLIMFYILPWTKPFTMYIIDIILNPVKHVFNLILEYLPNVIIICVILTITYFVNRFFRFLKTEIEVDVLKLPGFYPEWALPTYNIIRVIVWVFTIIVIWPYIPGSDSKIFQGISVFLGLIFSFTSASLISNIMSGFSLTYTRAFHLGDRIKIGDVTGDVVEKSMLVTKILTIKNEEVTIPNSKIMSSEVINYSARSKESGLILNTSVTIGYDSPWRKIHELLISAAFATEGIEKNPSPFVLQTSLDDFYISYQINAYTHEPNRIADLYSMLHQNIQDKFNEAGMEIMSPHYKAIRDGNTIAIPEENRQEQYSAPAFRIKNP